MDIQKDSRQKDDRKNVYEPWNNQENKCNNSTWRSDTQPRDKEAWEMVRQYVEKCVCLFGFFFNPLKISFIWKHQQYRWNASNFDLYSVLRANEHREFFSVPYHLWHMIFFYMVISEDPWYSHQLIRV